MPLQIVQTARFPADLPASGEARRNIRRPSPFVEKLVQTETDRLHRSFKSTHRRNRATVLYSRNVKPMQPASLPNVNLRKFLGFSDFPNPFPDDHLRCLLAV